MDFSRSSRQDRTPVWTRRRTLGALAGVGGLLAAAGGGLAACTGGDDDGSTVTPSGGNGRAILDVTSFGAVGDGRTDDTAAIQLALDSLKSKEILRFPVDKVFCHGDVLTLRTANVQLVGPGEIRATDEERSAFQVEASDVTIDGLTFGITATTQRWSTPDQHKLFIGTVARVTVRDVRITGSAAAGLFALGTSDFRFERVGVFDTRADGIHMTYGANNGTVDHPVVTRSGDDGVAVVSYEQDDRRCFDIEILSPVVRSTTGGRGISAVGAKNVRYSDISVDRSSAAAVYVACEGDPSNTSDTEGVVVAKGTVTRANTDADIDHGAVLVYSGRGGGAVVDVEISGLTISDTRAGASRQIGVVANSDDDEVTRVVFQDLTLGASPTPYQGNGPLDAIRLEAVTGDGRPVRASVSR